MINATGVLVHIDLGQAPLSAAARERAGCSRLHGRGVRSSNGQARTVSTAGAVHVVNNDAATLALGATSPNPPPLGAPNDYSEP
jgi:L-seryl-tRNA(Ser) seleniumtransferase